MIDGITEELTDTITEEEPITEVTTEEEVTGIQEESIMLEAEAIIMAGDGILEEHGDLVIIECFPAV
jgi:hypothetical protein